jgi:hypothetical protein
MTGAGGEPFGFAAIAATSDAGFAGADAAHPRQVLEASEEWHVGGVDAAEIDARQAGRDAGLFGQVHRQAGSTDVNLR